MNGNVLQKIGKEKAWDLISAQLHYSVPFLWLCIFNEDRLQSMNTLTTHRMSQDQFRNYREFSRPLHSNTIPKISNRKETKSLLERHTWQEDHSTSCPFFVKYWLHSYASISSNANVKEELNLYYIIKEIKWMIFQCFRL